MSGPFEARLAVSSRLFETTQGATSTRRMNPSRWARRTRKPSRRPGAAPVALNRPVKPQERSKTSKERSATRKLPAKTLHVKCSTRSSSVRRTGRRARRSTGFRRRQTVLPSPPLVLMRRTQDPQPSDRYAGMWGFLQLEVNVDKHRSSGPRSENGAGTLASILSEPPEVEAPAYRETAASLGVRVRGHHDGFGDRPSRKPSACDKHAFPGTADIKQRDGTAEAE
jgi:hypothetical protein